MDRTAKLKASASTFYVLICRDERQKSFATDQFSEKKLESFIFKVLGLPFLSTDDLTAIYFGVRNSKKALNPIAFNY